MGTKRTEDTERKSQTQGWIPKGKRRRPTRQPRRRSAGQKQQTPNLNQCNNTETNTETIEQSETQETPPIVNPKYPNIFNIARCQLSSPEKDLLSKGLKFCPYPGPINTDMNEEAIQETIRKIHIQAVIRKKQQQAKGQTLNQGGADIQTAFINAHKKKSGWNPSTLDIPPSVKKFTEELEDNLRKCNTEKQNRSQNLTNSERIALRRLKQRKDIILKPADKGSGICVLSTQQYKQEVLRQLENGDHYQKIDSDTTPIIAQQIKTLLKKYTDKGLIKEELAQILTPKKYRAARFYVLPKVHKDIQQPPGRPIMGACLHPTELLSKYIDRELNPWVSGIPSYIKDTNHLISTLKDIQLPNEAKIVTFDVTGLYTNIPHGEGIQAIKDFMTEKTTSRKGEMLAEMVELVLTSNVFEFNDQYYIQTSGTAMGTRMAPALANIFMSHFEQHHLKQAPMQPLLWKRYIDDILAIFVCTDKELRNFHEWLNSLHPTIKFTMETNDKGITFLDTFISIQDNRFRIRPHTKKTDTKQYIHPRSCHPPHTIKAIPYSQALRIKRICTDKEDLEKELRNLFGYFKNRDYDTQLISRQFDRAVNQAPKKPKEKHSTPITMVVTYHPHLPRYASTIYRIWNKHKKTIPGNLKPMVCYRRPRNLRDTLVKSIYTENNKRGTIHKVPVPLKNRPMTTYNKTQLTSRTNFFTIGCRGDHRITTDEFNTLAEAQQAIFSTSHPHPFHSQHHQCGNITIIPVKGVAHIQVRCTECPYTYNYTTKRKPKHIDTELKDAMHSLQKGLHRKQLMHKGGCYRPNCQCCRMIIKENHVLNPSGTKYTLPTFKCNSKNCIYVIRCTKCKIQYVGLTTINLRMRVNNHKTTIHKNKPSPVATHFNQDDHNINLMQIAILEHCPTATLQTLRTKEAMWIHLLDTVQNGMNAKDETNIVLDPHTVNIMNHFQHSLTCTPYTTAWIEEISQINL